MRIHCLCREQAKTRLVGRNMGTIVQSVLMRTAANGVLQAADSNNVNAMTDSTTT